MTSDDEWAAEVLAALDLDSRVPEPRFTAEHDGYVVGLAGAVDAATFVRTFQRPYLDFIPPCGLPADVVVEAVIAPPDFDGVEQEDPQAYLRSRNRTIREDGVAQYSDRALGTVVLSSLGRIVVIAPEKDLGNQVSAIVRDQILGSLDRANGFIVMHAACVADASGRGVLIVGRSGSGKTSTMLSLLQSGRWSLVSNDRTKLRATDGVGRGVPARVNMDHRSIADLGLSPVVSRPRRQGESKAPVDMGDLVGRLGVPWIRDCQVRLVLAPSMHGPGSEPVAATRIHGADAAEIVRESVMEGAPWNRHPDWLRWCEGAAPDINGFVERVVESVPVVRLVGPRSSLVDGLQVAAVDLEALLRMLLATA